MDAHLKQVKSSFFFKIQLRQIFRHYNMIIFFQNTILSHKVKKSLYMTRSPPNLIRDCRTCLREALMQKGDWPETPITEMGLKKGLFETLNTQEKYFFSKHKKRCLNLSADSAHLIIFTMHFLVTSPDTLATFQETLSQQL